MRLIQLMNFRATQLTSSFSASDFSRYPVAFCSTFSYKAFPMTVTSIRLSKENQAPLEDLAVKLDRSKNYIINQALKEYISRQAMDDAQWADTLEALSSIKKGNSIDESAVASWLESWGTDGELSAPSK